MHCEITNVQEFFQVITDSLKFRLYNIMSSDKRKARQPGSVLKSALFVNSSSSSYAKMTISESISSLESYIRAFQLASKSDSRNQSITNTFDNNSNNNNSNTHNLLIIVIRFTENLASNVMSDVISKLSICTNLRVHFLFFHSASVPMRFYHSREFQSTMELRLYTTISSYDLYDAFISLIVGCRNLPVGLSPAAIAWVHESFWRSERCVKTAMDR